MKPPTPPPPYSPPPLLTTNGIKMERERINAEFLKTLLPLNKDQLDASNESADQKNKKIVKDIIDLTGGSFIDDKLNANDQIFKSLTDNVFNLPPQVQQQLDDVVFKKIKAESIFQTKPKENISNIPEQTVPKMEDFFIDNDEFDEYKKPETISIKEPSTDDRNDFVIIPDNEKAKISKSLLKTDIQIKDNFKWKKQKNRKSYRKLIKNENLQDTLDVALADIQTINYNENTSLDDLETVDYENSTSAIDLVLVRKLKTIKEDENDDIEVIKTVQRVVINNDNDDDDVEFLR